MYLRLAFAVAAHLEPDILVVDEILAVGDAEFQRKCIGRMQEAEQEGRTLVFVSHDLETAQQALLSVALAGVRPGASTGPTADSYAATRPRACRPRDGAASILRPVRSPFAAVRVRAGGETPGAVLMRGDRLRIEVDFDVTEEIPGLDLAILVTTTSGGRVLDELLSDIGRCGSRPVGYRPRSGRAAVAQCR